MKPFIVCAAILINHRGRDLIICGPRHGDCINSAMALDVYPDDDNVVCGFVDQDNKFYNREAAWMIADQAGEIRRPHGWEQDFTKTRNPNIGDKHPLFSENLY